MLAVVLFHAEFPAFAGGFVGVDIFFVLSGFLITSIVESELERDRFSVRAFYERRIRRIFPALMVTAAACTLVAALIFSPSMFAHFGRSLLAMTLFVSNLYFHSLGPGTGYFDPAPEPQPLLHTWSIAIEEQFYLVFPALLLIVQRFGRRSKDAVLVGLLLLSFGVSVWTTSHQALDAFYLLPSRAWEFVVGALLTRPYLRRIPNRPAREVAGALGLLAIGYAIATYTGTTVFPGTAALVPCLGTALVLLSGGAGEPGGDALATRLLRLPPLVFLGIISYSLYLWHWPILVFTRYILALPGLQRLDAAGMAEVLAACLVAAILSYRLVELPFRTRAATWRGGRLFWLAGGVSASLCLVAGLLIVGDGLPQRFSKGKLDLIAANEAKKGPAPNEGQCDNFTPNPARAADAEFCETGHATHNILYWGDSHVYMLHPLFQQMQREGDLGSEGVVSAVMSSCPPTTHLNHAPYKLHCDLFARTALERALKPDIDTVYLGMNPYWLDQADLCATNDGRCVRRLSRAEEPAAVKANLAEEITELQQHGKRVVLSLQFPLYEQSIPDLEIRNALLARWMPARAPYVESLTFERQLMELAATYHLQLFDPRQSLCPRDRCRYAQDGVSLYHDSSHLSPSSVGLLRAGLRGALMAPGAGGNAPR